MKQLIVLIFILAVLLPALSVQAQFNDVVVCEPQGGPNPTHPTTYWYDVTPGTAGRCDFHVEVFDPNPADYTNVSLPYPSWQFSVHFSGGKWWASWWDPGCTNAIFTTTRFQFTNTHSSTWGDWRTTISGTNNPYAQVADSAGAHALEPDGSGYRVHVPFVEVPTINTVGLAVLLVVLAAIAFIIMKKRRPAEHQMR
jgi:hypothetical protein